MLYVVNAIVVLLGVAVVVGGLLYRRRVVRKIDDPPPWAPRCKVTRVGDATLSIGSDVRYGDALELGSPPRRRIGDNFDWTTFNNFRPIPKR